MTFNYFDMIMQLLGYASVPWLLFLFGWLISVIVNSARAESRFRRMMPDLMNEMQAARFLARDHEIVEFDFEAFHAVPPLYLDEWKKVLKEQGISVALNDGIKPQSMRRIHDTHIALYGNHYVTFTPKKKKSERRWLKSMIPREFSGRR
jgi:hypothetical protein